MSTIGIILLVLGLTAFAAAWFLFKKTPKHH